MGKKRHPRTAAKPARPSPAVPDSLAVAVEQAAALQRDGRLTEAEAAYRRILEADPDHGDALNNLAIILKQTRRIEEAFVIYERATRAMKDPTAAFNNLCLAYAGQRRFSEAVAVCRRALSHNPADAAAYFNLAGILRDLQRPLESKLCYERAIRCRPDNAAAYANLGNLLKTIGYFGESLAASKKAAELLPGLMEPYANIADALREHGLVKESIPYYAQALANNPKHAMAHSNLLMALNYQSGRSGEENLKAHRYWAQVHAEPLEPAEPRFANDRSPDRRLRVGFVSGDFRTHSVAYFLLPLIERLDRDAFEVVCYSSTSQVDVTTGKFKAVSQWRDVLGLDDAQLADLVRTDDIDILVDVSGHTGNNRLLAFARRPAPVQVTWLGYPNTTGMTALGYRLTDAVADPLGMTDDHYTERLIRLPGGFLCFRPLEDITPAIEPLPALSHGHVTFGSFNNVSKAGPEVIGLWAEVLKAVPDSRLILKHLVFVDERTRQRYAGMFRDHGVDPARVTMLARIESARGHFAAYHQIDIGLDPFPYNGTTTTCEALWMGVPVVALLGDQHLSRVSASILTQIGAADLVARDKAEYVAICRGLAANLPHLADLRRSLRRRMEASPLRDEAGFARQVGLAFREMWRGWCFSAPAPVAAPACP